MCKSLSQSQFIRLWLTSLILTACASGQPDVAFLPPEGSTTPGRPAVRCAELYSLTVSDFTIESAVAVPAEGDTPEFCRVMGQILPEIRFEVALPTSWNRRFMMTGNAGFGGDTLESPQRLRLRLSPCAVGSPQPLPIAATTLATNHWQRSHRTAKNCSTTPSVLCK